MIAAVLWTGGKDCALAMQKAMDLGHTVVKLITFVPKNPEFKAHPLEIINKQVELINISHEYIVINEPYTESYECSIQKLVNEGIQCLVTGDIDFVSGNPNWIDERCRKIDVKVFKPLWNLSRVNILQDLLAREFDVVFSAVKTDVFDQTWIGRHITAATIADLNILSCDLCGENGEYHTAVVDCPLFSKPLNLQIIDILTHKGLYFAKFSVLA